MTSKKTKKKKTNKDSFSFGQGHFFYKLPHQLQLCQKILQIRKYRVTNGLQRCRVLWNPFPPFRRKLLCKIWQHHKHSYSSWGKRECAVIKQAQNLRQMAASWRTSPIWLNWCHLGQQLPASKKTSPQLNLQAKLHTMLKLFHDFLNQIEQFSDWTLSLGLRQVRLGHLDWRDPCYHSSELARNHLNLFFVSSCCLWKLVSTTSWCF